MPEAMFVYFLAYMTDMLTFERRKGQHEVLLRIIGLVIAALALGIAAFLIIKTVNAAHPWTERAINCAKDFPWGCRG